MIIQKSIIVTILYLSLFISCQGISQQIDPLSNAASKETNSSLIVKKIYHLHGFNQSCCVGIVNYSLKEINGYIKSKANVQKQELAVWYNSLQCKEAVIQEAINKTGYTIE